jgi:cytochrome c oxidase cbb3-type subunit I/II
MDVITGRPLWFSIIGIVVMGAFFMVDNTILAVGLAIGVLVIAEVGYLLNKRSRAGGAPSWFGLIEHKPLAFTVLTLLAILIGGIAEIVPTVLVKQAVPATGSAQKPYTALEQQGRDLYTREGCYVCHSQMIRPMVAEYLRYGEASRAEEFIYDHPFQWGSKRTGPDLHRIGGKYPSLWHYTHMFDPRSTSPGSNMPNYPWLYENTIDVKLASQKLALMQKLGVPYTNADIDAAEDNQRKQAQTIVADLAKSNITVKWDSEIVALIAYLQRLGRDQGIALTEDVPKTASLGAGIGGGN